jgi:hypothetical protein
VSLSSVLDGSYVEQQTPTTAEQQTDIKANEALDSDKGVDTPMTVTSDSSSQPENIPTVEDNRDVAQTTDQVHSEPQQLLKEERLMAKDINAIVETMSGNNEIAAPAAPKSNVSAVSSEQKKQARALAEAFFGDGPARQAYTANNRVTAVISSALPAAKRAQGDQGIIREKKEKDKVLSPADIVAQKMLTFVQKMTGDAAMTVEKFKQLSDDAKYRMVQIYIEEGPKENNTRAGELAKAKAIWAALLDLENDPKKARKVVIPQNPSIPVKGYVIEGKYINRNDFINLLLDKTQGLIFSDAFVQGDDEHTTYWKLTTVKDKKASNTVATAGDTVTKQKFSVQPKNVKSYVQDPKHVAYMFEKFSETSTAWGSFKLALPDGTPATVSCATNDMVQSSKGATKHKRTTFTLNLSVECKKVDTKVIGAAFRGDRTDSAVDAYWGTSITSTKENIWDNSAELSNKPLLKVATSLVLNHESFSDNGNAIVAKIKAELEKQEAAAVAQDASQMNI